ncbi:hypothetical protein [Pasteurella bettyae]|uniref:Uncharacterized protein n=1 Tax=Pasteurella bettyae CCUG 2042 TaxID=1095749 RepID=I3DK91_9PAST|nr:hypothetical protein [Pasteurella bettyae]EIJ72134.1 hypothetical protein HMPREF1052_2053 [Pasteurella bettyae CCUG 2042]SUB20786.1 Uncharacterised protein [Pasteurella bettyae]
MRLAKLAMCDDSFVRALFIKLRGIEHIKEEITGDHRISVHHVFFDGEYFEVTITPFKERDQGACDCLFLVKPARANGDVIEQCFVGSGWMKSDEIIKRLEV